MNVKDCTLFKTSFEKQNKKKDIYSFREQYYTSFLFLIIIMSEHYM